MGRLGASRVQSLGYHISLSVGPQGGGLQTPETLHWGLLVLPLLWTTCGLIWGLSFPGRRSFVCGTRGLTLDCRY